MGTNLNFNRGSIWWTNLNNYPYSSVQNGFRPVVIVSSDYGCKSADIVTVCPLTTKVKNFSVNVSVKSTVAGKPQQVLTNQLMTLPKSTLTNYVGELDREDLSKVEKGIIDSLGLNLKFTPKPIEKPKTDVSVDGEVSLVELIAKAENLIKVLTSVVNKNKPKPSAKVKNRGKTYLKRSDEEIIEFIRDWEDKSNNRNEVAEVYGFSNYKSAYNFWVNHRNKIKR